jgi:hypothetical protein
MAKGGRGVALTKSSSALSVLELSCMDDGPRLRLFTIHLCLGFSCMPCFDLIFASMGFGCDRLPLMGPFVIYPFQAW